MFGGEELEGLAAAVGLGGWEARAWEGMFGDGGIGGGGEIVGF